MPENNVRQLTYGAMMASIFMVLILLSQVPLLTLVTTWFIPLPIALYASKFGVKKSIVVAIVGSLLVLLTIGIVSAFMAVFFAVIGMAMSTNKDKPRSKVETLFAVATASILMMAGAVYAYVMFTGVNIIEKAMTFAKTTVYENYDATVKLAESLDQPSPMTKEQVDLTIKTITETLPSMVILSAFFIGFLVVLINFPIMKKLGVPVQSFNAIKDLRLPKLLLLAYLIIILVEFITKPEASTYLYGVLINANVILSVLFFIQGISLIHFLINRSDLPKAVAWIATVLAFPLSSFVVLMGIVDLGFDLRMLLGDKRKK